MAHWSDCAVHNEPAFPNGPCNCGNDAPESAEIIQFVPKPNPDRPSLLEAKEAECEEFAAKAPALFTAPADYVAPQNDPA